jgi:hypothetical protein
MPWKTIYGAQGVEVHFSDRCDGTDLLDAHEAVYEHRYEEGLHYILADFAQVEYLDLSLADLLRIADHDRQYLLRNPPHLVAIVAPQAPVMGLLRTYEHYMEGSPLRTCISHTRAEALMWLRSEMLEPVAATYSWRLRQDSVPSA